MALTSDMLAFVVILAILVGGALLALLGYGLLCYRQEATEAALRKELLQRGMPVDDIIRILKASRPLDMGTHSLELAREIGLKQAQLNLQLKQAELKLKQEMVER